MTNNTVFAVTYTELTIGNDYYYNKKTVLFSTKEKAEAFVAEAITGTRDTCNGDMVYDKKKAGEGTIEEMEVN